MKTNIPFEKIDEYLRETYQCSFMSNAKWKKLLDAVGELSSSACAARYKLIHGEESYWLRFYEADDQFFAEPTHYKEVEWIEFPNAYEDWVNPNNRKAGVCEFPQDVPRIAEVIASLGEFESEKLENSIRIYAYR